MNAWRIRTLDQQYLSSQMQWNNPPGAVAQLLEDAWYTDNPVLYSDSNYEWTQTVQIYIE